MGRYLLGRFATMLLVLLVVSLALFALSRAAPGGPLASLLPPELIADGGAYLDAKKREFGLDQPLPMQYLIWLGRLVVGDLGMSFQFSRPVADLMLERVGPTVQLMGLGLLLGTIVAVLLGLIQASRKGSAVDYSIAGATLVLLSTPAFFLGMVGIFVFSATLGWLPSAQMSTPGDGSLPDLVRHLVLPVGVLVAVQSASMTRYVRVGVLEELSKDYVRTALAQGASPAQARAKTLRNALGPLLTILMAAVPGLLAGAVVLESVFAWPGMGTLVLGAIAFRDYPVILAFGMVVALLVVVSNLIADLLVALVDPRVRLT